MKSEKDKNKTETYFLTIDRFFYGGRNKWLIFVHLLYSVQSTYARQRYRSKHGILWNDKNGTGASSERSGVMMGTPTTIFPLWYDSTGSYTSFEMLCMVYFLRIQNLVNVSRPKTFT